MQRRQHFCHIALIAIVGLSLVSPMAAVEAGPPTLHISGELIETDMALARVIEQLLSARELDAATRVRLVSESASCMPLTRASAPINEPPKLTADPAPANSPTSKPTPDTCGPEPVLSADSPPRPTFDELRRWIRLLLVEQLGYCVKAIAQRGQRIELKLHRYHVVRQVRINGNWPIFEEEFLRRLSLRPGQRVPEGPELNQTIAAQRERLKLFLARRGYFDGTLTIRLKPRRTSGQVNVHVHIAKGKSYKVGHVQVDPMGHGLSRERATSRMSWDPAVPRAEIEALFRDKILFYQRGFNTARCQKHVQALIERYHQRGFPGVRIKDDCTRLPKSLSGRGVRINLQIQERKQIAVQYRGNAHLSVKELDRVLTLNESGAYDNYELEQSAAEIHKKYQDEGFLQARVHHSRQSQPTRDLVTFYIDEGKRHRVAQVIFSGNRAITNGELRGLVHTKTYPFLGLGEGGYVTDVQLMQDAQRIAELYRSRGFAQVRVHAHLAPHPKLIAKPGALAAALAANVAADGKLYANFDIEEGPSTRVNRVEIYGHRIIDTESLLEQMELRAGKPFSVQLLAADQARIKRLYFERGYPYVKLRVSCLKLDPTRRQVELLRLEVSEGSPVRFGPVLLRGNFRTRPSVIRSALDWSQGDPFDIRALERSELVLRQIGVFNSARIQVLGLQARLSEVPVLVTIEERYDDYGAIELGLGGSTDNKIFGAVGYNWRNVFGLGASINVRGELGLEIQSGNLDAIYPRAFGSAFGLDLQLYLRNELTERLGPLLTFGGTLTLSRELLRDLRALWSYGIRQVRTDEDLNRPAGSFDESRVAPVSTRTGFLSTSLIYDKRDNPLAPSRGYRVAGSISWAAEALAGNADFLTLRLNTQAYIPLPLNMTIALGLRYDHGMPLGGASILPRVERFFAGGDTTIRGFEEDRAFAERIESPLSPLSDASTLRLIPQGGNIRLLTNIEWQFPVVDQLPLIGLPVLGAVFSDNGLVRNSFEHFRAADFRHSLGLALRLVVLVGFLSVEYAVPLDPAAGDPADGRFHINFGFIF